MFPTEGETHRVNSFDESWTASALLPQDQPEHDFAPLALAKAPVTD